MSKPSTTETEAFARYAGEVLRGNPGVNHDENKAGVCRKGGEHIIMAGGKRRPVECVARPIDCKDWNVAMHWRDWAVEEYGKDKVKENLCHVLCFHTKYTVEFDTWLSCYIRPINIIEAVVRLVLKVSERCEK